MLTRSTKRKKKKVTGWLQVLRALELCGSRGGRPGLPVLMVSVDVKAILSNKTLSFGKVEVDVLGSSSLIVFMVSVDVKQHRT